MLSRRRGKPLISNAARSLQPKTVKCRYNPWLLFQAPFNKHPLDILEAGRKSLRAGAESHDQCAPQDQQRQFIQANASELLRACLLNMTKASKLQYFSFLSTQQ